MTLWTAALLLALGAPARAGDPDPPAAAPRLLNLLEADLSDPELRGLAAGLAATFQMLTRRPPKPGSPRDERARAPADEGGEALMAVCSGSFLPGGRAVTAEHCISRERDHMAEWVVLRRHLFRIAGGRLERAGHQDFAVTGRVLASRGDLAILELSSPAPPPAPATFAVPDAGFAYPRGQAFAALGYPSASYAVPFLSRGCRILRASSVEQGAQFYDGDCPMDGGMSGGPQFVPRGGPQIGVNSSTVERGGKTISTSPKMPGVGAP